MSWIGVNQDSSDRYWYFGCRVRVGVIRYVAEPFTFH